jgi:hypothetical protein
MWLCGQRTKRASFNSIDAASRYDHFVYGAVVGEAELRG